jgi:hypothetical protein
VDNIEGICRFFWFLAISKNLFFGLTLISKTIYCLLFWALPQGSGFSLQSFFGKMPKKGFSLQSLTQIWQLVKKSAILFIPYYMDNPTWFLEEA